MVGRCSKVAAPKRNILAKVFAGVALATLPVMAQEVGRSEATVQAFGSFVKTSNQNGIEQRATDSGGVLASYRFFFSRSHGIEGNYGYSRNTQSYGLTTGPLGVKSDQHEISAAYVYRHAFRRFTPFAEAGVAALVFQPIDAPQINNQTRAAFVYGAGADFNITHRFFARAQYRGLVYNSPTFNLSVAEGLDRVTHRAEPSFGFGFRF
jgi:outer membrane immunogenic protein